MTALLTELRQLSPAEKILLAEELWDSVLESTDLLTVTDAQKAELDRRQEAHQKMSAGSSWPEVKARLQAGR